MQRYFLEIAYEGSQFHGWQRQPNALSVQEQLEEGLATLLRAPHPLTGAGRTDAGVHCRQLYAHFDCAATLDANFLRKLNGWLPRSVAVPDLLVPTPPKPLHARFGAIQRTYQYYIHQQKDPFGYRHSWWLKFSLDWEAMAHAAELLKAHTDFASFCKAHGSNKTTFCKIFESFFYTENQHIVYRISADRFLRGMVRAAVGTLVEVGKGKLPPQGLHEVLAARNRSAAGPAAPPHGLFLERVVYPAGSLRSLVTGELISAPPAGANDSSTA